MACARPTEVDAARRRLLQRAGLAGCAAVLPAACTPAAGAPVGADFRVPGAGVVALDYLDARNFRLAPALGLGATWVQDGRIHLVTTPSLASGGQARVLLVGELGEATATPPATVRPAPAAADPSLPALGAPLHALTLAAAAGGHGEPRQLTVARLAPLAAAQHAVAAGLGAGMYMSLCADGVARLLATWWPAATAQGWAVVAHPDGARLHGQPRAPQRALRLPADVPVEDFRIRRRG